MARYKPYDLNQLKMIPLSYADQVVEGSFEHALNEIVEEHLDLSIFDGRYANDETGRLAYDPRILLKVVLYGYYKGVVSSRRLAEACRRMASELGLIGREHFAVDGCKLPSNASKRWSGTHEELADKRKKLEAVAARIVSRHRERDGVRAHARRFMLSTGARTS